MSPTNYAYVKLSGASMSPEVLTAWLAALRSGEYRQGQFHLRVVPENPADPYAYCCLGVLKEVAGLEPGELYRPVDELVSTPVRWALARMNDEMGLTFPEIADRIESGAAVDMAREVARDQHSVELLD